MIGTSNIMLPVARKNFPAGFADKSRLQYYASIFSTLEINSSFYKLPMAGTIGRWVSEVPPHFRFSFKLSREISHSKNLHFDPESVRKFMKAMNHAAGNKGCILIQFPAGLTAIHTDAVKNLLEELTKYDGNNEWQLALEFRDSSWYCEETASLLQRFSAIPVIHDLQKPTFAGWPEQLEGPRYYRFHGTLPRYRGIYSEEVLSVYASQITAIQEQGYPVYTYFNNSLGNAYGDALKLQQLINSRS